jgi:hypothetical protein
MKKLHFLASLSSVVFLASGAALVACGDDVAISVVDAGSDAPFDVVTPGDGSTVDVVVSDGGSDADADADANAGPALTVETFPTVASEAFCNALTKCCYGSANVPDGGRVDGGGAAGSWDRGACIAAYQVLGFEYSTAGQRSATNVALDTAKARDCLDKLTSLSCSLSGAELAAARKSCFEALVGGRTAGQSCQSSSECAKGNFCEPTITDGGSNAGTCKPLRAAGGSCNVVQTADGNYADAIRGEDACSWRGSGDTGLRCGSYNQTAGGYLSRDQWTCQPTVGVGAFCNATVSCNNAICDLPDYVCRSPVDYFKDTCKAFVKP